MHFWKSRKFWLGILMSAVFLYLAFRGIDYSSLWLQLKKANYWYLLPLFGLTVLGYVFRAVRWRYLIAPVKTIEFLPLLSATIIGFMANNILPARAGEFIRAYLLGKKEQISKSASFATIVVERLFDGLTVLVILVLILLFVAFPPEIAETEENLRIGGYWIAGFYVVAVGFLLLLRSYTHTGTRILNGFLFLLPVRIKNRLTTILHSFVDGLDVIGQGRSLLAVSFYSGFLWILSALTVYLGARAFGYPLPWHASFFVLVIQAFAVTLPSAPGFIGTYHYWSTWALMLYHMPREQALGISFLIHFTFYLPSIVCGIFFVWRDHISFEDVEKAVEEEKKN